MAQAQYYSPRGDQGLISQLDHRDQAEGVPMTALASRLVREGLAGQSRVIAEEPGERNE